MLFFRQQQQQQQQKKKALVLPLLFFLLTLCVIDNGVVIVHAEEVNLVVFLPPTAHSSAEGSYFPLAPALESVVRLAAEDLNEDDSLLNGDEVTLSVVTSQQATEAASGLCSAIETNKTFAAVSTLGTFSTSLLGSLSSSYLNLPVLSVGSSAARQEAPSTTNDGGFLLGVQPDIFPQMRALVRLILDMKTARDALDGRSETTERVWLVHTSDVYGSTAASAFNAATQLISVPLAVSDSDDEGGVFDDDDADAQRATVEITSTTVVAASSEAAFDSEMSALVEEEASIVVLLAEAYDGAIVRTVLSQARSAGLTEGVQWYLPDAAAMDHIFDRNSTYRDAELAFDMRGMLGVRPCSPRTGAGATKASDLLLEWQRLDPTEYPGAGAEGLTADGLMDPLLAFAYDAVFAAAAAVHEADEEIRLQNGRNLSGISVDRCPFPANGPWEDGTVVRDALASSSSTLTGATGVLSMPLGAGEEVAEADGRDVDSITFCAVNLRADATYGGRFQTISTLDGATLDIEDNEGFQAVSLFQEDQTFPGGGDKYPYDRPLLRGRHFDVVMRRDAPPFVFVDGDGGSNEDFTGITPSFLQSLSELLGFTYSLRATPAGTVTPDTIEMVRNGSADMTGSWITITSERAEFVAFTYPYYDLSIAFVYKPTVDEDVHLWKAFAPFEPRLWLALLFALLVTVFLLWLFEGAKNDQFSHGNWGKRRRHLTRGLSRSVYVTSSLMMTQLTHKPETLEGYLLTLGWLFSSFVLAASYTAELASYLTATRLESTDLTVNKLKTGEIPHSNVALLQGGNTQYLYERDFMRCSGDECDYRVQPQPCFSAVECLTMVLNGTAMTALADSATAEYALQNDFCGLATLPDALYPQHYGLVLPFDSPLVTEFQKATLTLREGGTLSDITDTFLDSSSTCVSVVEEETDTTNMTVADVSGVFVVLGMFVVIAMGSWCVRRSPLAKKIKARRRRGRGGGVEESVMESFAKMSRRQQKTFALEATVKLLQESKVQAVNKPSASEASGESLASTNNPAGQAVFRQEMAEGRPVVNLAGNSTHGSMIRGDSSRRRLKSVMNMLPRGISRRNRVADHAKAVRKNHGYREERRGGGGVLSRRGMSGSGSGLDATTGLMSLGGGGGGGDGRGGVWSSQGRSGAWSSRPSSPPPPTTTNPSRSATVQSAASKWLKRRNSSDAVISGAGADGGGVGRGVSVSSGATGGVGLGLGVRGGGDSGVASVASSSRDIMAADTAKTVAMVGSGDFEEDSGGGGKVWGEDGVAAAASAGGAVAVAVVAVAASGAPSGATGSTSVVPGNGFVPCHNLSGASEAVSTPVVDEGDEEEEEEEEGWGGGEGEDLAVVVMAPATLPALDGGGLAE